MGQPNTSEVVFIPLLCSFAFVSGNGISDQKCHILVVHIFIILAMPTTSCKQTSLIDDVM